MEGEGGYGGPLTLDQEVIHLKQELAKERAKRQQLEEELDLLAFDNERMRGLLASGGHGSSATIKKTSAALAEASISGQPNTSQNALTEDRDLFHEGDGRFADSVGAIIESASGGMNVLCVAFCQYPTSSAVAATNPTPLFAIACGGVDKICRIYEVPEMYGSSSSVSDRKLLLSYTFSGPILALDGHGAFLACSLMDGGHAVIDLSDPKGSPETAVAVFKDHSKYVVSIRWSPDGRLLVTTSHDKSVNVYLRRSKAADSSASGAAPSPSFELVKVHTARYPVTPEYALFAPCTSNSTDSSSSSSRCVSAAASTDERSVPSGGEQGDVCSWDLIVALRDTHYLSYTKCTVASTAAPSSSSSSSATATATATASSSSSSATPFSSFSFTFEERNVSLNEADWDTHVSFTPLMLSLSSDHRHLLVATDKSILLVLRLGTSQRIRVLAGGHSIGDYGKPRVAWDASGKYVFCNSDDSNDVVVYSVASERPVRSLRGHGGVIKDIVSHADAGVRLLITASFDKSVRLWGRQP